MPFQQMATTTVSGKKGKIKSLCLCIKLHLMPFEISVKPYIDVNELSDLYHCKYKFKLSTGRIHVINHIFYVLSSRIKLSFDHP